MGYVRLGIMGNRLETCHKLHNYRILCEGGQLSNEATIPRFLNIAPTLFVHLKNYQHADSENGKLETVSPEEGEVAGKPSKTPSSGSIAAYHDCLR